MAGEKIRLFRILAGKTQAEIAKQCGFSPEKLSQLERGVRKPKPEDLARIAKVLGMPEAECRP